MFYFGLAVGMGGMGTLWYFLGGGKAELQAEITALENEKANLQARLNAALASIKAKL
jgi:hypothetical protein